MAGLLSRQSIRADPGIAREGPFSMDPRDKPGDDEPGDEARLTVYGSGRTIRGPRFSMTARASKARGSSAGLAPRDVRISALAS